MSEDEIESFEITDYDLDNEFNPARLRRKFPNKQMLEYRLMTVMKMRYLQDHPLKPITRVLRIIQHQSILLLVIFNKQANQKKKIKMKKKEKEKKKKRQEIPKQSIKVIQEDERPNSSTSQLSFSLRLDSDITGLRNKRNQVNPLLMKSGMRNWEMGLPGKDLGKQLQGISASGSTSQKGKKCNWSRESAKTSREKTIMKGKELQESKLSQWRKGDSKKKSQICL